MCRRTAKSCCAKDSSRNAEGGSQRSALSFRRRASRKLSSAISGSPSTSAKSPSAFRWKPRPAGLTFATVAFGSGLRTKARASSRPQWGTRRPSITSPLSRRSRYHQQAHEVGRPKCSRRGGLSYHCALPSFRALRSPHAVAWPPEFPTTARFHSGLLLPLEPLSDREPPFANRANFAG